MTAAIQYGMSERTGGIEQESSPGWESPSQDKRPLASESAASPSNPTCTILKANFITPSCLYYMGFLKNSSDHLQFLRPDLIGLFYEEEYTSFATGTPAF
jgi:hypothetical protein